ncbi:MAG: hypothetical protein CML13_04955 [Puniceicoccaceae bacterium]|jgi:hypothetical protein|nr:hypothetical protein [Puniceicoccaceae bacterium]|tara:strand:+ start:5784 stop:6551 length:768 start_codon:yes stop_codon:yes gene_type:complete
MVALNTAYAPSETQTQPKNRVGDFFCGVGDCAGKNRPATRNRIGENGLTLTIIASGRPVWPSRDPIEEFGGGLNLYAFTLNNPLVFMDADGRWIWPFRSDPKKKCAKWIQQELNDLDWIDDLPDCPNKLTQKCENEWNQPDGNWSKPKPADPNYHPGAKTCLRSTNNKGGPGQQCCYADDGNLLSYNPDGKPHPGAGTPDARAPEGPIDTIAHYFKDVKMFSYCVKNLGDQWIVDQYMRVRPPNRGTDLNRGTNL